MGEVVVDLWQQHDILGIKQWDKIGVRHIEPELKITEETVLGVTLKQINKKTYFKISTFLNDWTKTTKFTRKDFKKYRLCNLKKMVRKCFYCIW